jgi:hypothetical protein
MFEESYAEWSARSITVYNLDKRGQNKMVLIEEGEYALCRGSNASIRTIEKWQNQ